MRIAILILLAFFLYRYFRKKKADRHWAGEQFSKNGEYGQGSFEEMVEDPYCKTFVQKGRAIRASAGGKTYFFCSKECRDKYMKKLGKK